MEKYCYQSSRRDFLRKSGTLAALYLAPSVLVNAFPIEKAIPLPVPKEKIKLVINGVERSAEVDSRMTLLDFLREQLGLTGTKKGCAMGQCGACIVHIDGKRMNSCLSLAMFNNGKSVTTIEGLAKGDELHPLQEAFVVNDAMQCGYCTPGQICSAVGMLDELKAGLPSAVTPELTASTMQVAEAEIRERMSGNICRCAAYPNIVAAILEAAGKAAG